VSDYRRFRVEGATYFFTVVTDGRVPLLVEEQARVFLRLVYDRCRERWPFVTNAIVLLPDHLHAIWSLPPGDADYSRRWAWIKKEFTKLWLAEGNPERRVSVARARDGRRGVWQPRFWEHMIRDVDDFEKHADYIHFNPVKHGYAKSPGNWEWTTFHTWVRDGHYPTDWGGTGVAERVDTLSDTIGE